MIECKGIYTFYAPTYQPKCWIISDTGKTHGPVNVEKALTVSCNYYFYETARRLGIDRLNDFGKKFGFGQYTGLEIGGEEKGILAGKEYRDSLNLPWYAGDTLQAAIGQSDNQITPVQLANYVATLVNGGTRYKVHLLKEVTNYTTGESIYQAIPEEVEKYKSKKIFII
jgi:penicillin-binding protein 2